MKHTPGPWHWDSDPIKGDPLNRVRYRVVAEGRTITQCYYTSDETGQAEADARLIAAAPDLLRAAREAEAYVTIARASLAADRREAIESVLPNLRAALAKATEFEGEGRANG